MALTHLSCHHPHPPEWSPASTSVPQSSQEVPAQPDSVRSVTLLLKPSVVSRSSHSRSCLYTTRLFPAHSFAGLIYFSSSLHSGIFHVPRTCHATICLPFSLPGVLPLCIQSSQVTSLTSLFKWQRSREPFSGLLSPLYP